MINVLTATMKEKPAGSMPLSLPKKKESGLQRRLYRKEFREAVERCCLIDLGMVGGGLTCSKRGLSLVQTKIDSQPYFFRAGEVCSQLLVSGDFHALPRTGIKRIFELRLNGIEIRKVEILRYIRIGSEKPK